MKEDNKFKIPHKLTHSTDGCKLEYQHTKPLSKGKLCLFYKYIKSDTKLGLELPMTEEELISKIKKGLFLVG